MDFKTHKMIMLFQNEYVITQGNLNSNVMIATLTRESLTNADIYKLNSKYGMKNIALKV